MVIMRLNQLMASTEMTVSELSRRLYTSEERIKSFLKREYSPTWEEIESFSTVFNCSIEDFLLIDEYEETKVIKGNELPPEMHKHGIYIMTIEKSKEIADIDFNALIQALKSFNKNTAKAV